MEVTVAMLLSAICITICYTAYSLIGGYYRSFQQQNEQTDTVMMLKQVMENDFLKSNYCLKREDGLVLVKDTGAIYYTFRPDYITRKINELHADTFKLQNTLPTSYFESKEKLVNDTIDEVKFEVTLFKKEKISFQLLKNYSAENLFH